MRMPTLLLPETTLRAPAVVPPTVVPDTAFRLMPSPVFPRSSVPAGVETDEVALDVLPFDPLCTLMPLPVLPEMTLPSPAVGPPIVLPGRCC